jgi:hypothetical protein
LKIAERADENELVTDQTDQVNVIEAKVDALPFEGIG